MQFPAQFRPLAALWLCLLLPGCGQDAPEEAEEAAPINPQAGFLPAADEGPQDCGDAGLVEADLFGRLEGPVRWAGDDVRCEGMPRPAGAGARLRFAGEFADDAQPIAFIIAIPALVRGESGNELPSNVTLIQEGQGRFFSTPDLDNCWTDVSSQTPLETEGRFRIDGHVYCISPLPEVNGDGSVTIDEITFSGLVDWTAS